MQAPAPDVERVAEEQDAAATIREWSTLDMPQTRRSAPTTLVVLASCAGVGALVLGVLAGVSTLSGSSEPAATAETAATSDVTPSAEQRALALLAKPSTERIVFRGSGGRVLLAVGSGGRAAILIRGLERAAPGQPYGAWIFGAGRPLRAARFNGMERAVFLTVLVRPHESVVIARRRPSTLGAPAQLVALRG